MANTSPIFVVGTPRSGTTLTARIIGSHSQVYMPGEVHFFDDIYSAQGQLGLPSSPDSLQRISDKLFSLYGRYNEHKDQAIIEHLLTDVSGLTVLLQGCTSYCEVLERFMRFQSEHYNKPRWGNNAPRDIFNVKEILDCYPDARFVVCVRDVRAFLLSYQGKWRNTSEEHIERLKKLYHPVVTSYLWKASMRQLNILKSVVPSSNYVIIRYEDLVRTPESTVRKICNVIGEEFEEHMLDIVENNSSHEQSVKGIFSSSVDKWKDELSPEEIHVSQVVAKMEMKNLGYEKVNIPVSTLKLIFVYLSAPYYLIRALFVNRHQTGPIIPYLLRRIGLLFNSSK